MGSIASSIGLGSGIISGIGGLIGGGSAKNYGSAGDFSNANQYLGQEGGVGTQYGQQAANALGQYGSADANYNSALGNQASYLSTNYGTDQRDASSLANATAGNADAYSRARANLMAGTSAAGLGGGYSAGLSGGMAGIESSEAGTLSGAQNTLANNQIAAHAANLGALTNLYGGQQSMDYSRGIGALGAQQGVDQSLAGAYTQQGQYAQGLELQSQNMANQSMAGGLGSLGQAAGQYQYFNGPDYRNLMNNGSSAGTPSPGGLGTMNAMPTGYGGNPYAYAPVNVGPFSYNPVSYGG